MAGASWLDEDGFRGNRFASGAIVYLVQGKVLLLRNAGVVLGAIETQRLDASCGGSWMFVSFLFHFNTLEWNPRERGGSIAAPTGYRKRAAEQT